MRLPWNRKKQQPAVQPEIALCNGDYCLCYAVCIKRQTIAKALPTKNFAEVLLARERGQRIERSGEAAAEDLAKKVQEWVGTYCPNRVQGPGRAE